MKELTAVEGIDLAAVCEQYKARAIPGQEPGNKLAGTPNQSRTPLYEIIPMNTKLLILCAIAAIPLAASPALADETQLLHNSSRNQLGLMKYCAAEGHISNDAVEAYQKIVSVLPAPADTAQGDQYESEGEQGYSFDGNARVSMQEIADGTGTTIADRCAQFAALTAQ